MRNFAQLPTLQKKALAKTLTSQKPDGAGVEWSQEMCTVKPFWRPLQTGYVTNEQDQIAHINQWFRLATAMQLCVIYRKSFAEENFPRPLKNNCVYMLVIDGVVFQLQERWRANFSPDQNEDEFVGSSRSSSQQSNGAGAKQSVRLFHHGRQILWGEVARRQILRCSLKFCKR